MNEALELAAVSLDCANPSVLGDFYRELTGGEPLWANESSVGLRVGAITLVMQRVGDYSAPTWPGSSLLHLDFVAGANLDLDVARALDLGARMAPLQSDPRWRVLLDPAGHPFCITTVVP